MCQAYEGEHQFILAREKWEREKKEREPAVTVREIEATTEKIAHDPPSPPRYVIRTYDPMMQRWCFDEMRDDKPGLTGLDSGFVAEIIDTRPDLRIGGQAKGFDDERASKNGPRENRFDCASCGIGVCVDEDGCCSTCGQDAIAVEGSEYVIPRAPAPSHGEAVPVDIPKERIEELAAACKTLRYDYLTTERVLDAFRSGFREGALTAHRAALEIGEGK